MHKEYGQIIAFHIGDRSGESAMALWEKYPHKLDNNVSSIPIWDSYKTIIPEKKSLL